MLAAEHFAGIVVRDDLEAEELALRAQVARGHAHRAAERGRGVVIDADDDSGGELARMEDRLHRPR